MENKKVLFNGKEHDIEKVLNIVLHGVRDTYTLQKYSEIQNIESAVESDKIRSLVITPFEGKLIALIKPVDLEKQITNGKIKINFCSKFLMKRLNATDFIIDTSPIRESQYSHRPPHSQYSDYDDRNKKPNTFTRYKGQDQTPRPSKPINEATKLALARLGQNSNQHKNYVNS